MKRLQKVMQRGLDNYLRIAVTGLSRSGKTAFITSLVNQLLYANRGARLPLFSLQSEQRLLGCKRVAQADYSVPRFSYDQGINALYSTPPQWPEPTTGVSEISLELRYRSNNLFARHLQQYQTLHLEIFDYPGEWLLDLPLLGQDYFSWSKQMQQFLNAERKILAKPWLDLLESCDPFAAADEGLLADISASYTDYLHQLKQQGGHFIQPGRFVLPGELAGAPALQFFPWLALEKLNLTKLPKGSNIAILKKRFDYYCKHVVGHFYQHYFGRFDRQIILVDCLQALNQGPETFNDMRFALTQLMKSFQYGKRTFLRRLFSPCIDKLMFAATKADHITLDQQANLLILLQRLIQDAWQHASFEGIKIDSAAIAAIQATQNGMVTHNGESIPAIQGKRLSDGELITLYPGEVPTHIPDRHFWQQQSFNFTAFGPTQMSADTALPHIRMDGVMEFLLGDKLR